MDLTTSKHLDRARSRISQQVRALRLERRWTQRDLAAKIGSSQARLSEVERGDGSFTAEQLLVLLQLFNVPASHFAPSAAPADATAALQNALARLGAAHLVERDDILPSERLEETTTVVREALVVGEPRLLTALGPVLIRHVDRVSLARVELDLRELGLGPRLPWLIENVLEAVARAPTPAAAREGQRYRRAEALLSQYLAVAQQRIADREPELRPTDVLDTTIRTRRSLDDVRSRGSAISRRWNIVTALQPEDFIAALEATHVADR